MKKYILITIVTFGLALSSCSNFLEEEVLSNVVAEEFYLTADGYESLVNANYSKLRDIYGDEPWLFCAGTDLMAEAQGRGDQPEGLSKYLNLNPLSDGVDHLYNTCYKSIQAANTALYYSDITEQTSVLDSQVGEIYYLRANAYFLLVQTYGGVSILKDYVNSPVLEFDRNTAEEVYNLIISDLEMSLSKVSTSSFEGKVTKRAVQHLLAKVYLTRGYESFGDSNDFSIAASYADAAIAGQALNIPFNELWAPGNEMNEEVLFSVQYSEGSVSADPEELGHKQAYHFGAYLGGDEVSGDAPYRGFTLIATEFTEKLFTEDDSRWEATFMTEVYARYYDYFDEDDHTSLLVRDFYEPQWFTDQDKTDYLANTNLALDFEYHDWGSHWAQGVSLDYQTITVKKFDDPESPFGVKTSRRSIVLSRLAETYLIAAEAYLHSSVSTSLDRINEVRRRAGVPDATNVDIDFILDERGRELFGEYHRWFDLKRTEKLVERASLHNYLIDEANFGGQNGELKILRPIPQQAMDLNQNKDFPQNPAY